jgi:UDP-N-acetylglucosamine:LPS N-acetylglucosamine transferase
MKKKNVLILYANIGKGHVSASRATKDALTYLYKDKYNVEVVDFFSLVSQGFSDSTSKAYDETVKHTPNFYKAFFDWTDEAWKVKFINKVNYLSLSAAFNKLLKKYNPDIIVSTFPIWDYGLCKLWKKKHPGSKFINIITDSISIHKAWLISDADYRIVPNEDTAKVLMKKLFTVLLFANIGNNTRNLRLIEKVIYENRDYNVIVVTGRNDTLMPRIEHLKFEKNVAILGWTTNVPQLMLSSDLIITKAGGATVMECIAAKKPMIITQVIPGQEEGNAELIKKHNLGIILEKGKKGITNLNDHIKNIRKDYAKYETALKMQSKPKAALQIAKLIVSELES